LLRIVLALLVLWTAMPAYTRTPPDANTGRPGEVTCFNCHAGVTAPADSSMLSGLPPRGYEPGATCRLALAVRYRGMSRWGFEITCADSAGRPAGRFLLCDTVNTQLGLFRGFQYVKQTGPGAHRGQGDTCAWRFDWRAPDSSVGPVTFYWDALPCNNDASQYGDVEILGRLTLSPWSPAVPSRRHVWRYPNPESTRAIIIYRGLPGLPLRIFASDGRLVGESRGAMTEEDALADWHGLDQTGAVVPAGDYFIELGEAADTVIDIQFVRRLAEPGR
jgi:hypothetical protein